MKITPKLSTLVVNAVLGLSVAGYVFGNIPANCSTAVAGYCNCSGSFVMVYGSQFKCCNTIAGGCCQRTCMGYSCTPTDGGSCTAGPIVVSGGAALGGSTCQANGLCVAMPG